MFTERIILKVYICYIFISLDLEFHLQVAVK